MPGMPPAPPPLGGMQGVTMLPGGGAMLSPEAMTQVQTIFANQGGGSTIPQGPPPGMDMGMPPTPGAPPMMPPAPAPAPPGPPMGMGQPPMGGPMPGQGLPSDLAGGMPPIPGPGPGPMDMGMGGPPLDVPPDVSVPGGASITGSNVRSAQTERPGSSYKSSSSGSKSKPTDRFTKNKKPTPKGKRG